MNKEESIYLQKIEAVIENFGVIQKELVLNKSGIKAVIDLIKEFSEDKKIELALDDPIMQKGKNVVAKVIKELKTNFSQVEDIVPPGPWDKFHKTLIDSIALQIKGYEIMFKTFNDYKIFNIINGKELVDEGIKMLEGGEKSKD